MQLQGIATGLLAAAAAFATTPAQAITDYERAEYRAIAGPECITDPGRIVAQYIPMPPNINVLRVRHMGDPDTLARLWQIAWPVSWDVGEVTGLRPPAPASLWQRGFLDMGLPSGTNAFQVHCTAAGFMINTWSFPHSVPVIGGGPHATLERVFSPAVPLWQRPDAELTLQVEAQVPWFHSVGGGVAQISFVYYLRHPARGIDHAHVIALWDSRPADQGRLGEYLANDTFTSFASTPLVDRLPDGATPRFASRSRYSSPLLTGPATWRGGRFFRVHVSRAQAAAMLAELAVADPTIDTDPSAWQLTSAMVFLEVVVGTDPARNLSVGASVRDFMVLEGTDP